MVSVCEARTALLYRSLPIRVKAGTMRWLCQRATTMRANSASSLMMSTESPARRPLIARGCSCSELPGGKHQLDAAERNIGHRAGFDMILGQLAIDLIHGGLHFSGDGGCDRRRRGRSTSRGCGLGRRLHAHELRRRWLGRRDFRLLFVREFHCNGVVMLLVCWLL